MLSKGKKLAETTHTITIAKQHLYYRSAGSGAPLVLLHGYGVSGNVWQRCLPYLAQQCQVFIVDLPGHGHSKLAGGPWLLREMAPLLAIWLRQMGLAPIALMGHSMGGAIAIHLAAQAPDLVERLVLVNAAGMPLETRLPTLMARSIHSMLQPQSGSYPWALIRDVLKPRPRVLWQAAQEMVSSDFQAELATITMPTLIIWGEHDVLLPLTRGQALSAALPHATFIKLPYSGHRPPLSQPEEFSRLVLEFLQEEQPCA